MDYVPFNNTKPSNWHSVSLSSIADFINGYSYKSSELADSNIAMATIKNFERNGCFKLGEYKEIIPSSKLKPEHHAFLFDILVAHTALTQNTDVIGNVELILSVADYHNIVFSMYTHMSHVRELDFTTDL